MTINEDRMRQFVDMFNEKIFPTMSGEDGKGIERIENYVEKRRKDVAAKKALQDTLSMVEQKLSSGASFAKIGSALTNKVNTNDFQVITKRFETYCAMIDSHNNNVIDANYIYKKEEIHIEGSSVPSETVEMSELAMQFA